jgi:hypothetical protein
MCYGAPVLASWSLIYRKHILNWITYYRKFKKFLKSPFFSRNQAALMLIVKHCPKKNSRPKFRILKNYV